MKDSFGYSVECVSCLMSHVYDPCFRSFFNEHQSIIWTKFNSSGKCDTNTFHSVRCTLTMLTLQSNVLEVSYIFDHELINFFVIIIVFVQASIVFPFVSCQLSQANDNRKCCHFPFDWASLSNSLWQKWIFSPSLSQPFCLCVPQLRFYYKLNGVYFQDPFTPTMFWQTLNFYTA